MEAESRSRGRAAAEFEAGLKRYARGPVQPSRLAQAGAAQPARAHRGLQACASTSSKTAARATALLANIDLESIGASAPARLEDR